MIWHEFCLAFSYNKRIRVYIDRRKKRNRWINWAILIASTTSAISYCSNSKIGAILAGLAAIGMVVKEIAPIFQQSESDLVELNKAATFFSEYQVKMECLYFKLKLENIHPVFCADEFFVIKEQAAEYITSTNEYFRGLPKRIENKINKEFDNYVREIYSQD